MDPIRRKMLAAGAAATVMAAARRAFGQEERQEGAAYSFYERGDVRIRYQEFGSGFPLLATPGGGLNSHMGNWQRAVINVIDEFQGDFRCITMDQRNALGGESTGPVPLEDPWGAFADDQLGLMDHLGIDRFFFFGNCIGGPFGLKLMECAPDRVIAGVLSQPVGHRPDNPDVMYNSGLEGWAVEFRASRPEVSMEDIETYLHNLYRAQPDFVYSVTREFVQTCDTPILVLPDDTPAHDYQTSLDIASLAPNGEATFYPWREPPELKAQIVNQVRAFLKAHEPPTVPG
jgi:pimeloyl-ACP methyl ester carboxylesterase